jgi:ubiquitin carboxyl-terminal hydrolase 48
MTKLDQLPPVLNLQLLRFVYDRNSGYKKKLSTKIKFSEQIDLKQFNQQEQTIYHLGAILMHCGKTAYSGHYMAQIKNLQTNKWFQFNDEVISELKKKQLLGCTEDETDKQNQQSQDEKQSKIFSTSNAYLLVYYRSDLFQQMKLIDTSKLSNQHEIIQYDNSKLEEWFSNLKLTKLNEFESKNVERETINSIYNSLWIDNNSNKSDSFFISTEFLKKLLTCQNNINLNEIAASCSIQKYICQHNKLNPMMINKLKIISLNGYKNLKEIYSTKINDMNSLFLKTYDDSQTRCRECVCNCFEYLKCKERLKFDMKSVRTLLKNEPLIDDVSKINTNELNLRNLNINSSKIEDANMVENSEQTFTSNELMNFSLKFKILSISQNSC